MIINFVIKLKDENKINEERARKKTFFKVIKDGFFFPYYPLTFKAHNFLFLVYFRQFKMPI
jgi:hypothetical protein